MACRVGVLVFATILTVCSAAPSWKLPKAPPPQDMDSFDAAGGNTNGGIDMDKMWKAAILASAKDLFNGTESDAALRSMFADWSLSFNKTYTSPAAYNTSLANFKGNLKRAAAINANKDVSYWADLNNQFADMSFAEFQSKFLMKKALLNGVDVTNATSSSATASGGGAPGTASGPPTGRKLAQFSSTRASTTVDWRMKDKTTPVKNQGGCGGCWAFAASAAIESAYHIVQGTSASVAPINLSEQQLVSCANRAYGYFSDGCNGGGSDDAISYVLRTGQTTESNYPYTSGSTGRTGACNTGLVSRLASGTVLKLGGRTVYTARNSQKALMDAVDKQPVIIYFDVAANFYSYTSGVYSPSGCSRAVNHAMVVVGYKWTGSTSTSYWIVRNSWGPTWGEAGHVRIRMTGDGVGPCLMQTYPHAPSLTFTNMLSV